MGDRTKVCGTESEKLVYSGLREIRRTRQRERAEPEGRCARERELSERSVYATRASGIADSPLEQTTIV